MGTALLPREQTVHGDLEQQTCGGTRRWHEHQRTGRVLPCMRKQDPCQDSWRRSHARVLVAVEACRLGGGRGGSQRSVAGDGHHGVLQRRGHASVWRRSCVGCGCAAAHLRRLPRWSGRADRCPCRCHATLRLPRTRGVSHLRRLRTSRAEAGPCAGLPGSGTAA
eukprot:Amastigsp_a843693_722.p2 type:complete len:165 gc:universal Amastigsp_a843693_722:1-495(+)